LSTACAHGLELSAGGPFPACVALAEAAGALVARRASAHNRRRSWRMRGRAGRPGRSERLISTQYQRRSAAGGNSEPARPLPVAERLRRNGPAPSVRIMFHRSIARCAGECAAVQEIGDWLESSACPSTASVFYRERHRCLRPAPPNRSEPQGTRRFPWASAENTRGHQGT
jgi:hypothetical protein